MLRALSANPWLVVLACAFLPSSLFQEDQAGPPQQERPAALRASVNLVIIDVQIVAAQEKPARGLTTAQFEVTIAGHQRKVVLVEFVHADEGPINPSLRTASVAACVFGFERSAKGANVHYLLAVESNDRDRTGIANPKVKVDDKDFIVRRLAWRRSRTSL
jgi:hypothetical protein